MRRTGTVQDDAKETHISMATTTSQSENSSADPCGCFRRWS